MNGLRTNRIDRFRLLLLCLLFGSLSGLLVEIATQSSLLGEREIPTVELAQLTTPITP
ncbi:MAG: hypothetical protein ACPHSD_13000 [Candidatus Latescibacterota bacterium]